MRNLSKIIVALDFDSIEKLRAFVAKLNPTLCRLKMGNILFTHYGPSLVQELMKAGYEIFLDLKFHDIPQTVAGAIQSAAQLGVWMVNLHISGGREMMMAARCVSDQMAVKPLLIGVTVLTSMQQQDLAILGVKETIQTLVLRMAKEAKECRLDGVVCSAQEAHLIRQSLGDDFLLITPGIRLPSDKMDDQKRVMTPREAMLAGSSYLVIGRPVTQAENPIAVLEKIARDIT